MSARETAELLLQVGRLVQAEGYDGELSPAQWMALRFFARANPFSRTPSAFAEFQATTRGTATQAIKALEASGYLVRQPFKTDGRSVSLRLTSKGKKALARDPFKFWCAPWIRSTRQSELRCVARCTKCCLL
jgi:DNA-binding MarR family transcriptional regulator